jgi:hypothetical protein
MGSAGSESGGLLGDEKKTEKKITVEPHQV